MEQHKLKSALEALILASEEPLNVGTLTLVLEPDGVTKDEIEAAIGEIKTGCNNDTTGFYLAEVSGGYQFRTKPEVSIYIQRLNMPKPSKLSQAALETLAIIAYRQPVVRSEIEDIRGVDSGGVLKTLLERNLVRIIGKRDEAGNPLIYGTTSKFMELFGLGNLKELPTLREYEELEKEHYKGPETDDATRPILETINVEPFAEKWDKEDDGLLVDLSDNIKKLRRLEKDIFPKPVETLTLVPNPASETSGGETDAATPAEDIGTGD